MCHFKEIFWAEKQNFQFWGYRTSFSGEPPFGYAQSGSERTSFSESTVARVEIIIRVDVTTQQDMNAAS